MRFLRSFLYRKKMLLRGITVLLAMAFFTILTLVSCAGITRPCVTCKRELATDPFANADEAKWDLGADEKSTEEKRTEEKRKKNTKADL